VRADEERIHQKRADALDLQHLLAFGSVARQQLAAGGVVQVAGDDQRLAEKGAAVGEQARNLAAGAMAEQEMIFLRERSDVDLLDPVREAGATDGEPGATGIGRISTVEKLHGWRSSSWRWSARCARHSLGRR